MFETAVVCYLFLGGAGAGACAVLSVMGFLVPRRFLMSEVADSSGRAVFAVRVPEEYRRLFSPGYVAALGTLMLGIVFLLVDLGRADRLLLLLQPRLTYLSIGAYALAVCVAVSAFAALMWRGVLRVGRVWVFRFTGGVQLVAAFVVMLYTGLLLWDVRAVPLWSTPWLPALFVLSALSCGIALVMGADRLSEGSRFFSGFAMGLAKADVVVVLVEMAVAIGFIVSGGFASSGETPTALAAAASLSRLLSGDLSAAFWGGFVACGLAAPLVIETGAVLFRRSVPLVTLGASALILVGGFFLRWCIVEAGVHPVVMTLASGV